MEKADKIPWKQLAVEAVAIVVSILLAFSIDAWWDNRLERHLESQQLSRLRVELTANIDLIGQFQANNDSLVSGHRIIAQIEDAQSRKEEVVSVPARGLFNLTRARNIEVETSAFDGLVRSGGLEVVRDQQVVSALAAWERSIADYTDLAAVARTTSEMLLLPALHIRSDTALAFRASPGSDTNDEFQDGEIFLRVDYEIKGLISQKNATLRAAGRALVEMGEAARAAVDAIDAAQPR